MYDDNEQLNNLTQLSRTVYQIGRELAQMYGKLGVGKLTNSAVNLDSEKPFVFTGKSTDLIYFKDKPYMPMSAIDNISDNNLKDAVLRTVERAKKRGVINIKNGVISLTDKGKKYTSELTFIAQAQNDQKNALLDMKSVLEEQKQSITDTKMYGVELNGTPNDLNVFNHVDKIKITDIIKCQDKELVKKVVKNITEWNKRGFIDIKGKEISLSEKGIKKLNSATFKKATSGLAEKAVLGTATGKVIAITKQVAKQLENVAQTNQSLSQ